MRIFSRDFNSERMRKDAKLTILMIEVFCVSTLAAYLVEHMFAVDFGVSSEDALGAGSIGILAGLFYLVFSAFMNALDRANL